MILYFINKMDTSALKNILLVLFSSLFFFEEVTADRCTFYTHRNGKRTIGFMKCAGSCCGTIYRRYCCSGHRGLSGVTIGWIALSIFVAVGFFVVIMCIRRRKRLDGQRRSHRPHRQFLFTEFGLLRTGNMNPGYSGPPGSAMPTDQSQTNYEQLHVGSLAPPAYETIAETPSNDPPKYESIYKT